MLMRRLERDHVNVLQLAVTLKSSIFELELCIP